MRLSVVIVTHNRREALRYTLARLLDNEHLPHRELEIIVVDNASGDGTEMMLLREYPQCIVIRREQNEGVSARNHAFAVARGQYVLLIDDDSHPVGDAVEWSMAYMDAHADTAAVVGRVDLPDGRREASAIPGVMINCAVCLRKRVLDEVGGFPREFFRQAEEYDLSLRIWDAGYRIERFEDLVYRHNKAPGGRAPSWIHRLDIRNNLILLERYFPSALRAEYRDDWVLRYNALARHQRCRLAAWKGRQQGRVWAVREQWRGRRTMRPQTLEHVLHLEGQTQAVAEWASQLGVKRAVLADFGKNIYVTWRACRAAGIEITAVADNHAAYAGLSYRGLPILPDLQAIRGDAQGVVLANINPAQVESRAAGLAAKTGVPVLALWKPRTRVKAGPIPTFRQHEAA